MAGRAEEIKTEILIIGTEAAGAKAAIEAQDAGAEVLVVTKGLMGKSGNTVMAGWGIQAPLGHMDPRDNPDVFFQDVVKGGSFLSNQKLVERLVHLALTEIPKMEKWGASFMKRGDTFVQFRLPGSSYPRTLHPIGYHGGLQWRKAFKTQFKRLNTRIMEDLFITTLLVSDGEVAGAFGISLRDGSYVVFRAKTTILATGGNTQLYRKTDGSINATGDGLVLAFDAGADLMDMEFQQFFPLCCYTPPFEMNMLTGNLRYGLHARFYNVEGEAFMERYMPLNKEWGLRDPTSRAIYLENKFGRGTPHGGAWIAVNHLPENVIDEWIKRERPSYLPKLQKMGIDIKKHALETGPASHYSMGGVRVNENCETGIPRLYAAGEVAAGMDGAERIDGGPAITWCLTMGYIVGKDTASKVKGLDWPDIDAGQVEAAQEKLESLYARKVGVRGFEVTDKVKDLMWENCALVRDKQGMAQALSIIEDLKANAVPDLSVPTSSRVHNKAFVEALEAGHLVRLAEMVVRAAIMREESRGAHYRTDFPKKDNKKWLKNIVVRKDGDMLSFASVPPVMTRMEPTSDEEGE